MFIKNYLLLRHKIIKELVKYSDSFDAKVPANNRLIRFKELKKFFPATPQDMLLDHLQYLTDKKEIFCSMEYENSNFLILADGRTAFVEKSYLTEGRKIFKENLFESIKIISTVLLLVIAVWTFINNINQTKKNEKDIQELRLLIEKNIDFKKS